MSISDASSGGMYTSEERVFDTTCNFSIKWGGDSPLPITKKGIRLAQCAIYEHKREDFFKNTRDNLLKIISFGTEESKSRKIKEPQKKTGVMCITRPPNIVHDKESFFLFFAEINKKYRKRVEIFEKKVVQNMSNSVILPKEIGYMISNYCDLYDSLKIKCILNLSKISVLKSEEKSYNINYSYLVDSSKETFSKEDLRLLEIESNFMRALCRFILESLLDSTQSSYISDRWRLYFHANMILYHIFSSASNKKIAHKIEQEIKHKEIVKQLENIYSAIYKYNDILEIQELLLENKALIEENSSNFRSIDRMLITPIL